MAKRSTSASAIRLKIRCTTEYRTSRSFQFIASVWYIRCSQKHAVTGSEATLSCAAVSGADHVRRVTTGRPPLAQDRSLSKLPRRKGPFRNFLHSGQSAHARSRSSTSPAVVTNCRHWETDYVIPRASRLSLPVVAERMSACNARISDRPPGEDKVGHTS